MWAKFQQFRKRLSGFRIFRFLADHLLPEWSYWVLLGLSLDVPYSILHPVRVTSALDSFLFLLGLVCYVLLLFHTGIHSIDFYEPEPCEYRITFAFSVLAPPLALLYRALTA